VKTSPKTRPSLVSKTSSRVKRRQTARWHPLRRSCQPLEASALAGRARFGKSTAYEHCKPKSMLWHATHGGENHCRNRDETVAIQVGKRRGSPVH